MKRILLVILSILPAYGFCDWKEYKKPVIFNFSGGECKLKIMSETCFDDVYISYVISIKERLFDKDQAGAIYWLQFLDEDGFLISERDIGIYNEKFTGIIKGSALRLPKSELNKVAGVKISGTER